ncbi:homoaconitate hydratase [Methanoculleus sp. YWC-01]|jgi:methanogen homocitrate synthase|uniref:Homoaconitate hydratase n=1 Tax=Methanoculleus nereidis TaxID=2735141 RepID=A0ABU3Z0Q4_9EURY|nr:homocitrate synthase family protein [Methanoculleus sp. YWC-01]MCK9298568.1 homocitrate synthase family protein [Methanoculleus sp.]MDV4342398.1 homoaconitate hydratase [Methanoculleus sp. YWC-01]
MKPWHIEICDVTLRDGEQTPGVSFTLDEKMAIARSLDEIGVEVIEAGFPVVSAAEKECVAAIARSDLDARVCCLARALKPDIEAALDCDVDMVSIFFATSDLHIRHKYRKPREEVLDGALDMVEFAADHGVQVRFAAEDASRTDPAFLSEMYARGVERGANLVSFADTVGCLTPLEIHAVVSRLLEAAPLPLCIHCHNDLGFAAANTITAAAAGAFQLHTTVNGIGERAGNAALEQVLVALRMKGGVDRYDLSRLQDISRLVARCSGVAPERTRPVVGENAFAHESGIHIAAILCDPLTYEYIAPEMVGSERRFILGKHTGRRALEHVAKAYGFDLSDGEARWVLEQVKQKSEGKCSVTREVLCTLLRAAKEGIVQ